MDRVATLLKKLQRQLDENSSIQAMLQTVQILQAELMKEIEQKPSLSSERVSVVMPSVFAVRKTDEINQQESAEDEKIFEVLQVDEKEIEKELEQIKRNAEAVNAMGAHRPALLYDPLEDIPTLSHQNHFEAKSYTFDNPDSESLNDKLKESKTEISQSLTTTPIKDLKKAIGVNDRFVFINDLFRGDEDMYERSIKTIQSFSIYAEAEFWMRRELRLKLGWPDKDPIVRQFEQLVKRRFM